MVMKIKCRDCKTGIIKDHPNRIICSDCRKNKLRLKNTNRIRKQNNAKQKECVVCHKSYFGYTGTTCSKSCFNIHAKYVKRYRTQFAVIRNNLFKSWVMWSECK